MRPDKSADPLEFPVSCEAIFAGRGVGIGGRDDFDWHFCDTLVEAAVTRNSAAATALYVDSVIAPILPDMQTNQMLDDTVTHALDETLGHGALGSRLFSFRLWRSDGLVLYSNDKKPYG